MPDKTIRQSDSDDSAAIQAGRLGELQDRRSESARQSVIFDYDHWGLILDRKQ